MVIFIIIIYQLLLLLVCFENKDLVESIYQSVYISDKK